jgi:hypothetical protein
VLRTALVYRLCRWRLVSSGLFAADAPQLPRIAPMPSMTVAEPLRIVRAA